MKNNSKGNILKLVFSVFLLLCAADSFARTFFISNDGNDSNTGLSETTSWKTLARVSSASFQPGDQVLFRRGDTFYGSLTIQSSGSLQSPITFSAFGSGPNPVITGFTTVTNWVNLGNNIWESAGPVSALQSCNMVVVDGKNTAMGRWPNAGYLTFESHAGTNSITDNQLSSSINWTGAEVVVRTNRYKLDRSRIIAQFGGAITFDRPTSYQPIDGFGYFIQNDPRTLDQQNEWYFDPQLQRIKIFSVVKPSGVRIANVDNLLVFNAGNVVIDGLSFVGANANAITNTDKKLYQNIKIVNCGMQYVGYSAIKGIKCNNFIIENNIVDTSNSYGIGVSGSENVIVRNNVVQNVGLFPGMTNNMWSALNVGPVTKCLAERNRIINVGYHGLSFYGNNIEIKNNYIDKFCQILDDGGGIYTYSGNGLASMSEVRITGNVVTNGIGAIDGTSGNQTTTAVGIYLDKNTTNVVVDHNSVSSCSTYGMLMNNPSSVRIHNNTFFNNNPQIRSTTFLDANLVTRNECYSNIFASKNVAQFIWNLVSQEENLLSWGKIDSNRYCIAGNENAFSRTSQPSAKYVSRSFDKWKTYMKNDSRSSNRLLSESETKQLVYIFNENTTEKTVSLVKPMVDLRGIKYSTSITLSPFTSVVLLPDPNPARFNIEYITICEGSHYQGWGTTGKYERTLKTVSGADSIVTTYLTVNPKYTVTEDITINEGESYQEWAASGQYKRILSSVSGCDSTVITNLTVLENSGKLGMIQPTHFIPVWQGSTGYNLMNFVVTSATLEDLPLQADDEIGVYSQGVCVGSVRLTQAISATDRATYLSFVASQNTGSNNGYTSGETVVFKIWDNSTQTEWTVNKVAYQAGSAPVITSGLFSPQATAIASLESYQVFTQTVSFKKGNNLFSTYLIPEDADVAKVMEPLCKSGALYKMQDEGGRSFEYWGSYGGWVNNIGNIASTEGYNVNVNFDCTLQITGRQKVALPLTIPLKRGWNFVSFPHSEMINAMTVVQPLIDQKKLSKVQDESGNSIENLKGFGWVNNIGSFVPGKAYKVYATSVASLAIQPVYTKRVLMMVEPKTTEFFKPVYEGNGVNHMNINLVDLALLDAQAGDEIAAFDGDLCVGALKLSADNLNAGFAAVVASYTTKENTWDGFTDGNPVSLVLWKSGSGEKVELTNLSVIDGQTIFARNSSVLLGVQQLTTGNELNLGNKETSVSVYPNPSKANFNVCYSSVPERGTLIRVLDLHGKVVYSREATTEREQINLQGQPRGTYLLISKSPDTSPHTTKIILN